MPADTKQEEIIVETSDRVRLFSQHWKPQNPQAVLIIVHNLGNSDVASDLIQWLDSHSDASGGTQAIGKHL